MTLYLNTTNFKKAILALKVNHQTLARQKIPAGKRLTRTLLSHIDLLLRENQCTIKEITAIEVATQSQDSFTGTRVGISVANALGFALRIPVNGGQLAIPSYEKTKTNHQQIYP